MYSFVHLSCLPPVYPFCVDIPTLGSGNVRVGEGEACREWWWGEGGVMARDRPRRGGTDIDITLGVGAVRGGSIDVGAG